MFAVFFLLLPIGITVAIGTSIYVLLRKKKKSKSLSTTVAVFCSPVIFYLLTSFAIQCDTSYFVRRELEKSLSPKDFLSLKSSSNVCPTEYTYVRNGKSEAAMGVSGFRGAKIYYSNETNHP